MSEELSPQVKRFIRTTINSVEQLEVLLFLMSNADRAWTRDEVSARTRLPQDSVDSKLKELYEAKLLVEEDGEELRYRYAPSSKALAEEVAQNLELAYREGRDSVIQLIYSRPLDNIRIFADAFRIKEEEQ